MYQLNVTVKPVENCVYLVPLGDIHYGSWEFTEYSQEKLQGYINWIAAHDNAYTFLMGDILNCSTITSPGKPYQEKVDSSSQFIWALNTFSPLAEANKILGIIKGNHEEQLEKSVGSKLNRSKEIAVALGIPYCGVDAYVMMNIQLPGTAKRTYYVYLAHGSGGGRKRGSKINRLSDMELICDADVYVCGHMHDVLPYRKDKWSPVKGRLVRRKVAFTISGSFLDYAPPPDEPAEGYGVQKMYEPICVGAPRIRLECDPKRQKDIHISI